MKHRKVAVIGIGHFGERLCYELANANIEVLAIDIEERPLERLREVVSQTIILDSTDEQSLKGIGIDDYDFVVVSIGEKVEESLITVAHLQNLKARHIVARACNKTHEVILKQMKVDKIFLPEGDAARQMARSLYLEGAGTSINLSKDYILLEVKPPEWTIGKAVQDLHVIRDYQISIITTLIDVSSEELLSLGEQKEVKISGMIEGSHVIAEGCNLLLFGKESNIRRFLNDN